MKFCAKCGNEIKNTKKRYCPYCNTDLSNPDNVVERDINISIQRIREEQDLENRNTNKDFYDYDKIDPATIKTNTKDDDLYYYEDITSEDIYRSSKKPRKKVVGFLLQLFVGFLGSYFFYIGFYLRGVLWFLLNVCFALLYFVFSYFAFFIILGVNVIMSLFVIFGKPIDNNNNFLV